jgi:hypothetical protein
VSDRRAKTMTWKQLLEMEAHGVFPPITDVARAYGAFRSPLNQGPTQQKLYDGMTASECCARFEARQRESSELPTMSPAQIAIAREVWAARLRARVTWSKKINARPKLTVMVEDQDEP